MKTVHYKIFITLVLFSIQNFSAFEDDENVASDLKLQEEIHDVWSRKLFSLLCFDLPLI